MKDLARDLLRGAIDVHIHAAPDIVARLLDDFELAETARAAEMAAIVLKSHHVLTADRAQIAQRAFPEVKVFGGLALNLPASGGLNPEAVKVAIRMGAKVIWLPTLSAANHIEKTKSVAEIKTVVAAALAAGVRKVLVNHPELWLIGMGVQDQRELAAAGAMMEVCARSVTAPGHADLSPRILAERIMAVGADHIVMATDYGQTDSLPAPEGMRWYIAQMLECGIAAHDVERMTKANPTRLLGL